jgi:hypothetical protein
MTNHIILAGDGVSLVDVVRDDMAQALADDRHPEADPVVLESQTFGFIEWARGAAASAIQTWAQGGMTPATP